MKIPNRYLGVEKQSKGVVGLLGFSLGKSIFYDRKAMEQYAKYLGSQFSESYLLIADLPKRHNIMALEDISEERALERVIVASEDFRKFLDSIISSYPRIHILNWEEATDDNYNFNLSNLKKLYKEHNLFREDCNQRVNEFLSISANKRRLAVSGKTPEEVAHLASNYLLEELSMLLSLPIRLGEKVCEIYPGINEIQEKLQTGEYYPNLLKNPERMFMEVYHE